MPPREVAGFGRPGRFPGIHHDDTLRVLDRPSVDREPPRPRVVQKHSRGPAAPAPKLCRLDLDAARLEGMDSERGVPALDVTYLLLAHHPSLE